MYKEPIQEKHELVMNDFGSSTLTPPVNQNDHIEGNSSAPVTLVEYGDFECPDCGRMYPVVKELQRRIGNQMRFVYREFPLAEIHPHAEQAAEAAEAAGAQRKFWPMFNELFQHQNALDAEDIEGYAEEIGLNMSKFNQDMNQHTFENKVMEDEQSGEESGVQGTPTFFINGVMYDGSYDVESLQDAVESAARG